MFLGTFQNRSKNFNSLREKSIFDYAHNFDLCFVQESLISDSLLLADLGHRWPGESFWSPALGKQGGVGVLINDRFQGTIVSWRKDSDGRILSLLLDLGNIRLNLINIYAPANLTDRKNFFEALHQFFIPSDGIVLGGDFNCYDSSLDKFGGNVVIASYFVDFKSGFKLVDVWRKLHPRAHEMTWFNSDFSLGSHLDKFLLSPGLLKFATSCSISPCSFSDDDFVNLVFDFRDLNPRGPGLWKFNVSLIDDDAFCNFIASRITDLIDCQASFSSIKLWWDFFKESIKLECLCTLRRSVDAILVNASSLLINSSNLNVI